MAVGEEARITTSGTMGVGEGRAVDMGREEETGTRRVQGGKRRGDRCEERGQRELEVCGGRRGRGREHGWRQPGGIPRAHLAPTQLNVLSKYGSR